MTKRDRVNDFAAQYGTKQAWKQWYQNGRTGPNIDSRYGLWVPDVVRLTLPPPGHFLFLKRFDAIALRHINDVEKAAGLEWYCASMCVQTGHDPARAACQARTARTASSDTV